MTNKNKTNNLWTIVAILLLLVVVAAGYKFKSSMSPTITAVAKLDTSCDLHNGSCTSELPNTGKVTFSITPNNIPVLQPLELNIKIEGVEVSKAEVDFVGVNMDMGYNQSALEKIDATQFKGKAVIPVCVRSKMEWNARVLLHTKQGLIMAPFHFYTIK